ESWGQEELLITNTSQEVHNPASTATRCHKLPSTCTEIWTEEVKSEVWKEYKNTFRILGQLSRL
ncbi:hypothetical protein BGZ81_005439, partial [Podila clonocystis]